MSLSILVLLFVILAGFLTVVGVVYLGAQEDLSDHHDNPEALASVTVWRERANRLDKARRGLVQVTEGASVSSDAGAPGDEAEARRAAALARKAARANK